MAVSTPSAAPKSTGQENCPPYIAPLVTVSVEAPEKLLVKAELSVRGELRLPPLLRRLAVGEAVTNTPAYSEFRSRRRPSMSYVAKPISLEGIGSGTMKGTMLASGVSGTPPPTSGIEPGESK